MTFSLHRINFNYNSCRYSKYVDISAVINQFIIFKHPGVMVTCSAYIFSLPGLVEYCLFLLKQILFHSKSVVCGRAAIIP